MLHCKCSNQIYPWQDCSSRCYCWC